MADRWEKDRGSWILARAGHSLGARRRGEKLMRTARRHDRYESGAGDATSSEVTTRSIIYRSIFREEGAANTLGWVLFTIGWVLVMLILVGPALLVSRIAYGIGWLMVPRWGRLAPGPFIGIALILGITVWLVGRQWAPEGATGALATFGAIEGVLGVLWTAWLTRAFGWPAVARRHKQSGSRMEKVVIEVPTSEVAIDPNEVGDAPEKYETAEQPVAAAHDPEPEVAPVEVEIYSDDELESPSR